MVFVLLVSLCPHWIGSIVGAQLLARKRKGWKTWPMPPGSTRRVVMTTYIHKYIHTYIHTCTYIHTYIHTYIDTYIHTYIILICMLWSNKILSLSLSLSCLLYGCYTQADPSAPLSFHMPPIWLLHPSRPLSPTTPLHASYMAAIPKLLILWCRIDRLIQV